MDSYIKHTPIIIENSWNSNAFNTANETIIASMRK